MGEINVLIPTMGEWDHSKTVKTSGVDLIVLDILWGDRVVF